MNISRINEDIIEQIRKGSEKAFSDLFSTYYSYLNAVALCYLVDKEAGAEIVNDVFINIWNSERVSQLHSGTKESAKCFG